jgi:hypothetical protein
MLHRQQYDLHEKTQKLPKVLARNQKVVYNLKGPKGGMENPSGMSFPKPKRIGG